MITVAKINALLPQTQCELCTYKGCKPYAEAIVNDHERIDRCLPGGVNILKKIAALTGQDATPYIKAMQAKQKPLMTAVIREAECIGCTKCIQACPVDAILGATKLMHTVITHECSGCELCIEPCPVDCIDMITLGDAQTVTDKEYKHKADYYKWRYENRHNRLAKAAALDREKHQRAKKPLAERQRLIEEALARRKASQS